MTSDSAVIAAPGLPGYVMPGVVQGLKAGDAVTPGLRAEHLRLSPSPVQIPATIRLYEHLGRETVLYVDAGALQSIGSEGGAGSLTLQLNHALDVQIGQTVTLGFDPAEAYVFGPDGNRCSVDRSALPPRV